MLKSIFHWKVLVNLLLAIGVFTGLIFLTFQWLDYHTRHGQEIPVPNLLNKKVHEAIKILDDYGLEYEVDSFKYDPKYKSFQVLQIFPAPGSRVKAGRSIILKVNPKTWAKVIIPDILDRYKGTAFQQLERTGLSVADTLYEPSIQKDAVIRMLINGSVVKPGMSVPRFTKLSLVIGTGPLRNINVPNVTGMTVDQAKAEITRAFFEVGRIEFEDGKVDGSAVVYFQDPAGMDIRDQGMQIDLWASKRPVSQLQAKINSLTSMYRVKIDESLPPVTYDDVVYPDENYAPPAESGNEPTVPEVETPIPAPKPVPKPTPKAQAEKPNTGGTKSTSPAKNQKTTVKSNTKTSVTPPTQEKPKKKIIIE